MHLAARRCVASAIFCCSVILSHAQAPPPIINYQGRVSVEGINIDGVADFKFALVDEGIDTANPATASATVVSGFVVNIQVIDGGSGYTSPPAVTITDSTGVGAAATASVVGGSVSAVTVQNAGGGYSATPTVSIDPPPPDIEYLTYWSHDGTSVDGGPPASSISLPVQKGLFSVLLGDSSIPNMTSPLIPSVFAYPDVRLRVWFDDGVNGLQHLLPDQRLASVPYALIATPDDPAADLIAGRLLIGSGHTLSGSGATIAGGDQNQAHSVGTAVGGGARNIASNEYATVGGGWSNRALGAFSTVSGGTNNLAGKQADFVGGGRGNVATGFYSVVVGGQVNRAAGWSSAVLGGFNNVATNDWSAIVGGIDNRAFGNASFVGGGFQNYALDPSSAVVGGSLNRATNDFAFVGGGIRNVAAGFHSAVVGGTNNLAGNRGDFVGAGRSNISTGFYSVVAGGEVNRAVGVQAAVLGGFANTATGITSAVVGGENNLASGGLSFVGAGNLNRALGLGGVVVGGSSNWASNNYAFVGGGRGNRIGTSADYSMILGGLSNTVATGASNSLAAGRRARVNHPGSFVWADAKDQDFTTSGANQFLIRSDFVGINRSTPVTGAEYFGISTLASNAFGGMYIEVPGTNSRPFYGYAQNGSPTAYHYIDGTAGNWRLNIGSGDRLIVAPVGLLGVNTVPAAPLHVGGVSQIVARLNSSNAGGSWLRLQNTTTGGRPWDVISSGSASPEGAGRFMIRDSVANAVRMAIRTDGFVGFGTSDPAHPLQMASGAHVTAGGTWTSSSDVNLKNEFEPVDAREILNRVAALPIQRWSYLAEPGVRHIGPTAQDFHAAFAVGVDDKGISQVDSDGVSLSAIQGLYRWNEELQTENRELREELRQLREQLISIERRLSQ